MSHPNILFIMTDQQRYDTIAALGNELIYTPNYDRLVQRGVSFTRAYSACPVCVPARYNIRTGCEPSTNGFYGNGTYDERLGPLTTVEERCGPFLPRRMGELGYRTFGIGKEHSWHAGLGYETALPAEEMWGSEEERLRDAYAGFIAREHPEFAFLEQLHGERTEMYYMPQMSPLPADLTCEAWAADRAVENIAREDGRPWFGFVSFIGPHPPCAPPIPYNRLYDPDRMSSPVLGDLAVDHMDEQIPWMNSMIWADDISPMQARALKARYYGEITYIDACIGRMLGAVDARSDADNTLICFFTDHGDHLGDHHAWQKESFFEQACHIPFLVSWPSRLPAGTRHDGLVCLTDLFGIATTAAGAPELRDGHDLLGMLAGTADPRESYVGMYEMPGSPFFKLMVLQGPWKYIYMANGGREQLFNLDEDPQELRLANRDYPDVLRSLREMAITRLAGSGAAPALSDRGLLAFPYRDRPRERIVQMDGSRGVNGFPAHPRDVLARAEK